jgi:hypothetical protein
MSQCWLLAVLGLLAGCQAKPAAKQQFVPPALVARTALESVLRAWVENDRSTHASSGPQFQLVDSERDRRRLTGFTIQAEVPLQGLRGFETDLQFDDAEELERRQYVIVGVDPLWVFPRNELERLAHWEMSMPDPDESSDQTQTPPEPSGADANE